MSGHTPAITLRQMRAFLAVAELGSFTKASPRLRLAQPALSQLVKGLEQELAIRLLDRTTRRVELTEGGREFQRAASRVVQDLDMAIAGAKGLAERSRGRVVVAAPPFLAADILPPAIAKMSAAYPGLQVSILDTNTAAILEAVRSGNADFALGTFPATESDLERSKLVDDSLVLVCSPIHRFARRRKVRWRDLADEPLITLTRDSGIRLLVELGYEAAQVPMRADYQVFQISTALALAAAGRGITILPAYAQQTAAMRHQLKAIQLIEPAISRDIELIRASGRSMSPAAATFAACLRTQIRSAIGALGSKSAKLRIRDPLRPL